MTCGRQNKELSPKQMSIVFKALVLEQLESTAFITGSGSYGKVEET